MGRVAVLGVLVIASGVGVTCDPLAGDGWVLTRRIAPVPAKRINTNAAATSVQPLPIGLRRFIGSWLGGCLVAPLVGDGTGHNHDHQQ